jgi:hypothetical protein
MALGPRLFEEEGPAGLSYRGDFITEAEQTVLVDAITGVTFSAFEMRGVVARRRVAYFGQSYDRGEARPFPAFLCPLRERIAAWASVERVTLEPRSAYLMTGESRTSYEHHIPPVGRLRYSVTFRTLR